MSDELVNPRDGHPLVLIGEDLERFDHFAERGVRVFVDDDLVEIFLVRPLDARALLQRVFEIFFLGNQSEQIVIVYLSIFSIGQNPPSTNLVQ